MKGLVRPVKDDPFQAFRHQFNSGHGAELHGSHHAGIVKNMSQFPSFCFVENDIVPNVVMCNEIDNGAVGFYQIISEIEGIELVVVVNPECRVKAGSAKTSGDITSHHSISVIQAAVDWIIGTAIQSLVKRREWVLL